MPEELCQVSPKSHYGVLASHSDPSPCGGGDDGLDDNVDYKCITLACKKQREDSNFTN